MDAAIQTYLHETLGLTSKVQAWPGAAKLPYFLQTAFDLRQIKLLEQTVLLAIDRHPHQSGLAGVSAQLDKLAQLANSTVVYVTSSLASYERRRLIEQKVPFIVPGNQLYLPPLGLDLREHFRQRAIAPATALSPAAQAMLIAVFMRQPWRAEWLPAEVVQQLGYTAMTLSRAVKEITAANIATLRIDGKTRWLQMAGSAAEAWERARPLLRSPVKRRLWIKPAAKSKLPSLPLAGLSALAKYSMLAEPPNPVYAVSPQQWKALAKADVETLPEPLPGACEWELWHYAPAAAKGGKTSGPLAVEPLSLALSLQGDVDERVQLALDELKERFPW